MGFENAKVKMLVKFQPTFYVQLFREQIPKSAKETVTPSVSFGAFGIYLCKSWS